MIDKENQAETTSDTKDTMKAYLCKRYTLCYDFE